MNRPKKYMKSHRQEEKERERRRKLRVLVPEMIDAWPRGPWPSQTVLAGKLGVSQATVSRDLKKLSSSRWNPFDLYDRKVMREIREKMLAREEEERKKLEGLSDASLIKQLGERLERRNRLFGALMNLSPPKRRGRPFSKEFQPRWGRIPPDLEEKRRRKALGLSDPEIIAVSEPCPICRSQEVIKDEFGVFCRVCRRESKGRLADSTYDYGYNYAYAN